MSTNERSFSLSRKRDRLNNCRSLSPIENVEENHFHRKGIRRASSLPSSNRTKQSLKDWRSFFTLYKGPWVLGMLESSTTILKNMGWHEKGGNPIQSNASHISPRGVDKGAFIEYCFP